MAAVPPLAPLALTPAAPGPGPGRILKHGHDLDRKIIRLVRERRLLYARNTLSVGNYHSKALKLWKEIARMMNWTVADVKRKWSHIRNSYSRHIRNELNGARTIKGRVVSKWYLADELEFLREHMATDLRTYSTSYPPEIGVKEPENVDYTHPNQIPWSFSSLVNQEVIDMSKSFLANEDGKSSPSKVDENSSYFTFFRGIYDEYLQLSGHRQRQFKQRCLIFLHDQLDAEEQDQSAQMVIEESTSEMDDDLIIKNECVDPIDLEQSVAVENIITEVVDNTLDDDGVEQAFGH